MELTTLNQQVKEAIALNEGRLPFSFINTQVTNADVKYHQLSPNMRVCVIHLQSGHEVIGVAQVLDSANDVEKIGNEVAHTNAVNELWKVFGAIALS